MTAFSAAFNTWLIDLEPNIAPLPLVGWAHTGGLNVMPLVIGHPGPLVTGEAFLLQNGQVYDPAVSKIFEDEGNWRDTIAEDNSYRPGSLLTLLNGPAATPVARIPTASKKPVPAGQIQWGTKAFKGKSFWTFTESNGEESIFVVEGDSPTPKNATKITRDEFFAKRKLGGTERSGWPDDEPELPLSEPEMADDFDDLI